MVFLFYSYCNMYVCNWSKIVTSKPAKKKKIEAKLKCSLIVTTLLSWKKNPALPHNWVKIFLKEHCYFLIRYPRSIRRPHSQIEIWIHFHKVSFFVQFTKMQLITLQNFNIQTCFSQFLSFFSLKCWFKGQIISRIHIGLPNAYKLMCFDRNINGNCDVKFWECG